VVRTFNGPGRVKIGITASAASTPTMSQVRPLRVAGRPFELLLVPANQLSFSQLSVSARRGQLQASIYHCCGCRGMPLPQAVVCLDAAATSWMRGTTLTGIG
jgi:hypothetical protein